MENVYIGLGNGGFEFFVEQLVCGDDIIPLLNINARIHGHQMGEMKIRMTPDRLIQLGDFLKEQAEKSKSYYKNHIGAWEGSANSTFSLNRD